jgi:glycosyltransferase involved in cell wall biosynthesis
VRVLSPRAPVQVVYNGVDLSRFAPDGPLMDLDAAAGQPPAGAGTLKIGLVAAFGRWKGHEVFFQAAARLPREIKFRAYVVGDSLYETDRSQLKRADLESYVGALGIADRVAFTGFAPDASAAMRALDIVVHASTAPEPFGMVIAEAMACGRPVVASLDGGAAEIVLDGADAFGHSPGDARSLAEQLARLATDRDLRALLGRRARQSAELKFDRKRLARELAPLYSELAETSRCA